MTIWFFVFDLSGNAVAMIKNNETFHIVDPDYMSGLGEGFVCDTSGQNYGQYLITHYDNRLACCG